MANAPVLNGQAGSLIGILDAVLVTGFDIKPLTSLVVADGVATATFLGSHAAQMDSVILVEGVTGALAGLNGEQKITAKPTTNTLTFATPEPDGTAAGAITIRMAPAGWARPFASGNVAVYTSTDPQSHGMLLRVDDSGATSARVRGFETLLDVDTGTGPFPTDAMLSGGGYWNKSAKADATAVPWVVASDGRMMLLWMAAVVASTPTSNGGTVYAFGDPISYKPGGDAYSTVLAADLVANMNAGGIEWNVGITNKISVPRAYSGLGSAVAHMTYPYIGGTSSGNLSGNDNTLGTFPNTITGELYFSRRYIVAASSNPPRADVPGVYYVPQSGLISFFSTGDVVTASESLQGRNMFALRGHNNTGNWNASPTSVSFIDQTGPWR
jgi:hypothetical protein